MNHRAVFLLGLFVGASSCWQTRAVQVALQKDVVYSCPQSATVTVTGASLMAKPVVALAAAPPFSADASEIPALNQEEVSLLPDGTLQFALPRRLGAGNYQVLLTFTNADQTSTVSPGNFEYSLDTPNLTSLVPLAVLDGPTQPSDVMLWRPEPGRGPELAVLSGSGTMLTTYPNQQTRPDLPPSYDVALGQHTSVQSSNLIQAPLDPQQQTSALVACAPLQASGPTAALSIANTGLVPPTVQLGAIVSSAVAKGQLVVSGNFSQKSNLLQLIQLVLPATGTDGSLIGYKNLNLASPQTPGGMLSSVLLPVNLLLPVTVVSGELNGDTLTDVLLVADRISGANSRSTVVVAITGELDRSPIEILAGASVSSVVALGDLDGDEKPDLAFGQTPSGVKIYYNRIPKGAVIAYAGTDAQTAGTVAAPKKLAIVDYDGDRINDLVYAASDGVHVVVNHGVSPASGQRTFDDTLVFAAPTGWDPAALIATDFSGDRRPDFVVADGASGKIWLLENSCDFP